jgi:transcriptional regulator with XRE-family HTH domain
VSEYGIHWRELDEDLSFEGFFREKKSNPLYDLFIAHPELNASAVARRLGLSQSLFAQYVSGTKKPSKQRFDEIIETIREIGRELMTVPA